MRVCKSVSISKQKLIAIQCLIYVYFHPTFAYQEVYEYLAYDSVSKTFEKIDLATESNENGGASVNVHQPVASQKSNLKTKKIKKAANAIEWASIWPTWSNCMYSA